MVSDDTVRRFLENPENFLFALDWRNRQCLFVPANREALSALPFLDQRTLGTSKRRGQLPFEQVLDQARGIGGSCDFIFHTGFCCSTLIARVFDRPGKVLSLKEPFALLGLSGFRRQNGEKLAGKDFKTLSCLVLGLLARPFRAGERTLLKPSNGANNLLPDILESPHSGKVLLLYASLESFLASVISGGEERQNFIDGILPLFLGDFGNGVDLPNPESLSGLERAALVWALQVRHFFKVAETTDKNRVRTLDCQVFLDRPAETFKRLDGFFGYAFKAAEIDEVLSGPVMKTHAKEMRQFEPGERDKEKQEILKTHQKEITKARGFLKTLKLIPSGKPPNRL